MTNPWTEPYKEFREETVLSKKDGVEGKLDKVTGKFTPTPFSAGDKERYAKNTPLAPNGTGPVKRDEPLWDGPETPTKPPVPTGGPKLRDEPLWDGPNKWETPTSTPTLQPKPQRPIPTNASPVTTSTADKIKGGLSNYQSQVKSGDVKGAEETGRLTFALANPKLAAAQAEKDRIRGTSQTDNPLMQDMRSRMPMTPSVQSPTLAQDLGNDSGNQSLLKNPNASIGAKPKPEITQATKTKVAFGNPSLLSQTLKKEENVITGYLVREGYVKPKKWFDDDGDGIGYEKGEVSSKFKKKKK